MGKPYDIQYHLAPVGCSVGTMECGSCGKKIDPKTQDFREHKRNRNYDWGYVTHHRSCLADQAGFEKLERQRQEHVLHNQRLLKAAIEFRGKWKIDELNELIEFLTADDEEDAVTKCECGQPATTKYDGDDYCAPCAQYSARRDFEEGDMP